MGFSGDFHSYPLPDLLQWLDAAKKSGTLRLSWDGGERTLSLVVGEVTATGSPGLWERIARVLSLCGMASSERVLAAFTALREGEFFEHAFLLQGVDPALAPELAREELFGALADLTLVAQGSFRWTEAPKASDSIPTGATVEADHVPLTLSLRALLFEALRWVDEQPEVERMLPSDAALVRSKVPPDEEGAVLDRVLLTLCASGMSLARLRLALGISRSAAMRRVYDLLRQRRVEVEGAPALEDDPIGELLDKGLVLLEERQYEAAGLVFQSLLGSDPTDRRVRDFAKRVEEAHQTALRSELPAKSVPVLTASADAFSRLRPEERHVATLINGLWDVGTLVLASRLRELDTLKALQRLQRQGLLALPPGPCSDGDGEAG